MKIKHKLPPHAYAAKPQVIVLKKSNLSETPEKYLKAEILNLSLLMPKEFAIRRLFKTGGENYGWKVMFQNKGKALRGVINLSNEFPYREEEYKYLRNPFGHISKFDLDKYMRTNNWNPAVVVIRSQQQKIGEPIDIKEIHMNGNRGFWERRQQTDEYEFFSGEFTLYKKEEDQFAGGSYVLIKKYFDEKDILTILSSIEFLKSENPGQSQNHYEKGLMLYKQGDILQSQIEFANAYMLSPENPDFTFMFAKSLLLKETENYDYVRDLLNDVLKIKPDYKGIQKLLKEIESKLPKGVKSN
jgi:tetratricopeptide (TPR) repeat protein